MRRTLKTNRVGAVQIDSNMYIKQKYGTVLSVFIRNTVAGEDIMASFGQINFRLLLHAISTNG